MNDGKWIPIDKLEDGGSPLRMFVVIALNTTQARSDGVPYTSDPYCVWKDRQTGKFERWPHPFPPTHYFPLPAH
jgi:hypothetical protein